THTPPSLPPTLRPPNHHSPRRRLRHQSHRRRGHEHNGWPRKLGRHPL
ncbi:uncharacterized protein METZ01_LOCUS328537, partial [marine metagenome]